MLRPYLFQIHIVEPMMASVSWLISMTTSASLRYI